MSPVKGSGLAFSLPLEEPTTGRKNGLWLCSLAQVRPMEICFLCVCVREEPHIRMWNSFRGKNSISCFCLDVENLFCIPSADWEGQQPYVPVPASVA